MDRKKSIRELAGRERKKETERADEKKKCRKKEKERRKCT